MTQIPVTMTDHINEIKAMDISYRVLHPSIEMNDEETGINATIPFSSVVNKYKDFLKPILMEYKLSEEEQVLVRYKPKLVSETIYHTTELWDVILLLNNCLFASEFTPTVLKVYDPKEFKKYLNEIMLLEEELGEISY